MCYFRLESGQMCMFSIVSCKLTAPNAHRRELYELRRFQHVPRETRVMICEQLGLWPLYMRIALQHGKQLAGNQLGFHRVCITILFPVWVCLNITFWAPARWVSFGDDVSTGTCRVARYVAHRKSTWRPRPLCRGNWEMDLFSNST